MAFSDPITLNNAAAAPKTFNKVFVPGQKPNESYYRESSSTVDNPVLIRITQSSRTIKGVTHDVHKVEALAVSDDDSGTKKLDCLESYMEVTPRDTSASAPLADGFAYVTNFLANSTLKSKLRNGEL